MEGIIRPYQLGKLGLSTALVMEDSGGVSLGEYLSSHSVTLEAFFKIALKLTETLGLLHQKNVVHRDIKPGNIIIAPETLEVKIADFGLSGPVGSEAEQPPGTEFQAGTPAYMSPEQTGRTGRSVDERTDLYSLGVAFYEMLTGELPFQAEDPAGWAHAHITKAPAPPVELNQHIHPMISAIIVKLLSKNPEDRYQGAYGLLADLEECRRQWSRTGEIRPFPIGQTDLAGRFELPRKLYGREKEAEALTDAFESACSGRGGILLVYGYPGTGKTALINQFLKPLVLGKGYFIAGKFDQLQRHKPYVSFIQAFGDLIRQILTESQERLAAWKRKLLRSVGRSGAVITEVIPEVELIIGTQPPVEALPPKEAQNRFRIVMRRFIRVFAQKGQPLVIFLDDLQWADPASIQLIRYLSDDPDSRYLLLVGAYRDNEVSGGHPLTTALEGIQKNGIQVRRVPLDSLDLHHTRRYIADALQGTVEKSYPLAEIMYRKTGGNPFFLGQLLQTVYDEKLLGFNIKDGCWEWDPASVQELEMPDDVVDLMQRKLQRLPEKTRDILKMAACIGNSFDLSTLSAVCEKTPSQTASHLHPAVLEKLVLMVEGISFPAAGPKAAYEFLHDRVQQTAYSLIPEDGKKEVHLKAGRLILENTGREELDDKILAIMDHLNVALDLIRLSGYNLAAGRKARDSAAYESALNYFKAGVELLQ